MNTKIQYTIHSPYHSSLMWCSPKGYVLNYPVSLTEENQRLIDSLLLQLRMRQALWQLAPLQRLLVIDADHGVWCCADAMIWLAGRCWRAAPLLTRCAAAAARGRCLLARSRRWCSRRSRLLSGKPALLHLHPHPQLSVWCDARFWRADCSRWRRDLQRFVCIASRVGAWLDRSLLYECVDLAGRRSRTFWAVFLQRSPGSWPKHRAAPGARQLFSYQAFGYHYHLNKLSMIRTCWL